MEQRRLGRTGHMSTVVTFGTAGIGKVDQETADLAIQFVLDRGVNHFDVAPRYGEAEVRLQPWMSCIRERIFLGCKTGQRTREAATAELHRSLERLGTDRLDLYQLHAVGKLHELDECTAKGGALEALIEARESGIARWLGITGHTHDAPRTHLEALHRFDFDTVMFPLNFVLWSNPQYRRDAEAHQVLARGIEHRVYIRYIQVCYYQKRNDIYRQQSEPEPLYGGQPLRALKHLSCAFMPGRGRRLTGLACAP